MLFVCLFVLPSVVAVAGQVPDSTFPGELLQLHPSVLKPDLDLSVCEVDTLADLQTALSSQVHVEQELLLQLKCLMLCVRTSLLASTFSL